MNNVFSLRHHSSITQMSLSMPKKLRGQLYRLFISYEEGKESFLLRAVRDYEVFHGDIRGCEGYFDNAFSLNLFFEKEKPERILDLIELFESFYELQNNQPFSEDQKKLAQNLIEEIWGGEK